MGKHLYFTSMTAQDRAAFTQYIREAGWVILRGKRTERTPKQIQQEQTQWNQYPKWNGITVVKSKPEPQPFIPEYGRWVLFDHIEEMEGYPAGAELIRQKDIHLLHEDLSLDDRHTPRIEFSASGHRDEKLGYGCGRLWYEARKEFPKDFLDDAAALFRWMKAYAKTTQKQTQTT